MVIDLLIISDMLRGSTVHTVKEQRSLVSCAAHIEHSHRLCIRYKMSVDGDGESAVPNSKSG